MIKLVALDLDGTLVDHDLHISERTLNLLQYLIHQTPVKVVIATGRMYPSALPFVKHIGTLEPIISYQGAMIRAQDARETLLHHAPIPMTLAEAVLTRLVSEQFSLNLYVNDVMFTNHDNHFATRYARISGITPIVSENILEKLTAAPSKIMAIDDHRIDELLAMLKTEFATQLNYCRSRPSFCEIIDASVCKWQAIKRLADQWHILPEEILAMGDQENDLTMITHAGIGVAMGDAPDHVKAMANYVTQTVEEDGAANAIEQFVLGDMPLNPHPERKDS